MKARANVEKLNPLQRINLVTDLLRESLKKAREVGFSEADCAEGLLNLTLATMCCAIGTAKAAKWLLDLSNGLAAQAEAAAKAERN